VASSPRAQQYTDFVALPVFQPLPLTRRPEPFSHPDWLFEVKYDGFRALAYADPSGVRLVSRKGNRFASFTDLCAGIELFLKARHAVLDGEIACLDDQGYSQFNELLFHRGSPRFCAFDLLHLDGKDLRNLPLIERKRALRKIIPGNSVCLFYVDHIEGEGERLFELACERDLEGIVAKHRQSRYSVDHSPTWVKIKNRKYSQLIGRDELFERRYEAQGAPEIGWDVCARAASSAL
jgi:bifunctional non-homologous end joining protein LigD